MRGKKIVEVKDERRKMRYGGNVEEDEMKRENSKISKVIY